jgi:type III restriction enzyme
VAAVVELTIGIPRIVVQPKVAVRSRFERFDLNLTGMQYQPVSNDLWVQYLATAEREVLSLGTAGPEKRLEDYVVNGLCTFDDIDYEANSEVLYGLADQVVGHLRSRMSEDAIANVLRFHQRQIAELVHVQMQSHYLEEHVEYEVEVKQGFTEIRQPVFTAKDGAPMDYRRPPPDKASIAQYVFGGFSKCIVTPVKFQSDPERVLAVILEREAIKWFRPSRSQFQIYYRWQGDEPEYQPDFAVEAADAFYMLEVKRRSELEAGDVIAKKTAGLLWCQRASAHATGHGGKPWKYVLIPHDAIAENMTLSGLSARFSQA